MVLVQGWGGTIQLPVSGVLNGAFSTATTTIDEDVGIDCGGPQPWEILAAGMDVIYEDTNTKLLLSRQRTSYRHAHEGCKWFGGVLVSLNSRAKQNRLVQVRPRRAFVLG